MVFFKKVFQTAFYMFPDKLGLVVKVVEYAERMRCFHVEPWVVCGCPVVFGIPVQLGQCARSGKMVIDDIDDDGYAS